MSSSCRYQRPDGASARPGSCRARPTTRSRSTSATAGPGRAGSATGSAFDVYPLRTVGRALVRHRASRSRKTGATHRAGRDPAPLTGMEGRELVRVGTTWQTYRKHPDFAKRTTSTDHEPPTDDASSTSPSPRPTHEAGEGNAWGMAINLNTCIGCNACVSPARPRTTSRSSARSRSSASREMHWIADRPLLRGRRSTTPTIHFQPVALHALREGPLRARLPGRGDDPQRRGAQRDDLQPLRRHAVLLEQLPVQGPAVQLLPVLRRDDAQPEAAEQPRRDGPAARGDGEVHVLRPADQRGADRRRDRGSRRSAATRS